jgi:EAL domain-containing protein (putative c-di-GMP-specific phosphodiesterase class I)
MIVSAIINMGKSLKYRVIAEGIETQEQKVYLRTQQCAEGQGYLFSRPVAAEQFASLLQRGVGEAVVH